MRSTLVITSVGFHIVVVAGFFVAGFWKLERLDAERRPIDLAVAPQPPPAPSGGPSAAPSEPFKKKPRTVTKTLVQPHVIDPEVKPAQTATEPGLGAGGTGTGTGSGSGTDPTGTGTCIGDGCGEPEALKLPPPLPPAEPKFVPPTVLKGMRLSGETQVHPPATVKTAILRDGKNRLTAVFRVCVGTAGEVVSLTLAKSSGYGGYDTALDTALRNWKYKPYEIGGRKVAVCGMVTFIYSLQ